jgi:Fe-S cluster assembly protein SufD
VLTSLREAVKTHPELLRELLATEALPPEEGKFQALNAALWTDGILLYVPKGVRMELPVRVTRWFEQAGARTSPARSSWRKREARSRSWTRSLSDDLTEQTLVSTAVEVFARDGAQVQYVSLQRMGKGTFHLSQQRTLASRDSTLDTLNVSLGASVSRVDLNAELRGPGANSDMLGLYFGDEDQHFDHNTSQDHVAPHAKSDLLYKGALDGRARSVFRGIIKVHKGAQGRTPTRRTGTSSSRRRPAPTRSRTWRSRRTTCAARTGRRSGSWTRSTSST